MDFDKGEPCYIDGWEQGTRIDQLLDYGRRDENFSIEILQKFDAL
jgi:hypothetical protein